MSTFAVPLDDVAIVMNRDDNVAVAKIDISEATLLIYNNREIIIRTFVPKGHRFALHDVQDNEVLKQYGFPFGVSKGIKQGCWLNPDDVREYHFNYEQFVDDFIGQAASDTMGRTSDKDLGGRTFLGYVRNDGKVGTRNYYLIMPTSLCASDVALRIANTLDGDDGIRNGYANIDGIVAAAHTEGCGCGDGIQIDRLLLVIRNTLLNPNVAGALIIDLGCEKTHYEVVSEYLKDIVDKYDRPIDFLTIQECGGTRRSVDEGVRIAVGRLEKVNSIKRRTVHIKHLVVGTECGASDSFSGITANPVIGRAVDKIIMAGGSAILSETPEMIGAETCLIKRMTSKAVAEKFVNGMNWYKDLAERLNVAMDGNFVAGNRKGGLINLTLKSLGAILKGGSTEIVDYLDYGELLVKQGLNIMNGPGNDLESCTGEVASGANIIVFSTGLGTTEGNLLVPVIKVPTRTEVFNKMNEDMDFNSGRLLDDRISIDELSDELISLIVDVASGKKTWSEVWGKRQFQIWTAGKLSL